MRTILILTVLAIACGEQKAKRAPRVMPDVVVVDHILIGVRGDLPVQRSKEEARELADKIVARLEAGEDWNALKNEFSDDPPSPGAPKGGPCTMDAKQPKRDMELIAKGIYSKDDMAVGFADTSFGLEVGEIGIAEYDMADRRSPFGYHIIKRIK